MIMISHTTMRSIGTGIFILLLNLSLIHSLTRTKHRMHMTAMMSSAQFIVAILLNRSTYVYKKRNSITIGHGYNSITSGHGYNSISVGLTGQLSHHLVNRLNGMEDTFS